MARDDHQKSRSITDVETFPPTVTAHDDYANGVELQLLDSGTEQEPRYVWIPEADDEETVFSL